MKNLVPLASLMWVLVSVVDCHPASAAVLATKNLKPTAVPDCSSISRRMQKSFKGFAPTPKKAVKAAPDMYTFRQPDDPVLRPAVEKEPKIDHEVGGIPRDGDIVNYLIIGYTDAGVGLGGESNSHEVSSGWTYYPVITKMKPGETWRVWFCDSPKEAVVDLTLLKITRLPVPSFRE